MTLGKTIALTCSALVLSTALVGGFATVSVQGFKTSLHSITTDSLPGMEQIGKLSTNVRDLRVYAWRYYALGNAREQIKGERAGIEQQIEEALRGYNATIANEKDRDVFSQLVPAVEKYRDEVRRFHSRLDSGDTEGALQQFSSTGTAAFKDLDTRLSHLVEVNRDSGEANAARATSVANTALLWTGITLAASILAGFCLAWWIVRRINTALGTAARKLGRAADEIVSASGQVASSSQMLAQGASEQAAAIETTSASAEQISAVARKGADNTRRAGELIHEANGVVERADTSLNSMLESMSAITTSSEKIGRIIRVIDEIAFQTNILALNAAVEAARAGAAGQGFAVVADEVRSLAHRSADAAKETEGLINECVNSTGAGRTRLNEVVEAMADNAKLASRIAVLIREVETGSAEQLCGLEQITTSVLQVEQTSQANAATAEESAAASEELSSQAASMRQTIQDLQSLIQ